MVASRPHIKEGVRRVNECLSCAMELEQNKGDVGNCSSDEAEEGGILRKDRVVDRDFKSSN